MSLLSFLLALTLLGSSPAPLEAPQPPASSQPAQEAAEFRLSVEPRSVSVRRGSAASLTITVTPGSGDVGRVELSSSALYDTRMAFEPPSLDGARPTGRFTIAPGPAAIKGEYIVTITALARGTSQTAAVKVQVR